MVLDIISTHPRFKMVLLLVHDTMLMTFDMLQNIWYRHIIFRNTYTSFLKQVLNWIVFYMCSICKISNDIVSIIWIDRYTCLTVATSSIGSVRSRDFSTYATGPFVARFVPKTNWFAIWYSTCYVSSTRSFFAIYRCTKLKLTEKHHLHELFVWHTSI